jgi:hypothetical protein
MLELNIGFHNKVNMFFKKNNKVNMPYDIINAFSILNMFS